MISKSNYKPRFIGYHLLSSIIKIIDGIISLVVFPFGYVCTICLNFCVWNLKKDAERNKNKKLFNLQRTTSKS
jgi:hypothetical protein